MKILVLCPYPQHKAPSQRLKFEQYYDSWRAAGFDVDVRPFWSESAWEVLYTPGARWTKATHLLDGYRRRLRDVRDARSADLVYLHLEAAPLGPALFERVVARSGVPIVYDIDDLVYLRHSSAGNRFMHLLRGGGKVARTIGMASHVVVCTDYLRDYATRFNGNVTNISSTIDTDQYVPRPHRPVTRQVVVGWTGSHSTARYLHVLDGVLRRLQASDGIRVKVIGDASFTADGVEVEAQDWRLESEVADLSDIDIGVYPMADEPWVMGKSGLKALQYMALEIPVVAQRVGSNLTIVEDGTNGFLAESAEEWESALRDLIVRPDVRRRVGTAGRRTVEARYSVRATEGAYLRVLYAALAYPARPTGPCPDGHI